MTYICGPVGILDKCRHGSSKHRWREAVINIRDLRSQTRLWESNKYTTDREGVEITARRED